MSREWSLDLANAYVFTAFAGLTDGMQDEEFGAIAEGVKAWNPEAEADDIIATCKKAFGWVSEDLKSEGGSETVIDTVIGLLSIHKNCFENLEKNDDSVSADNLKKEFMQDLVKIAMADNNFHDNEKKWLNLIAKELGIEFSI